MYAQTIVLSLVALMSLLIIPIGDVHGGQPVRVPYVESLCQSTTETAPATSTYVLLADLPSPTLKQ